MSLTSCVRTEGNFEIDPQATNNYFWLEIVGLPRSMEDMVVGAAFEKGAQGVSETLTFEQDPEGNPPDTFLDLTCNMQIFFLDPPGLDLREWIQSIAPSAHVSLKSDTHKDWLLEWKKGYKSFELVEDIWIVPSWLEAPEDAKKVINIDPGMAFGTGTHATTQVAAQMLYQLGNTQPLGDVLDVGTGTGILAILSSLSGASEVMGIEIDRDALRTAQKNCELNQVSVDLPIVSINEVKKSFDVVIANIIEPTLIELNDELFRCCKPNGKLILSGVLSEHKERFQNEFQLPPGWFFSSQVDKGEWAGFLIEAKS